MTSIDGDGGVAGGGARGQEFYQRSIGYIGLFPACGFISSSVYACVRALARRNLIQLGSGGIVYPRTPACTFVRAGRA